MSYAEVTQPDKRRVADQLRDMIRAGRWKQGEQLPSANELAALLDSKRTTVAGAVEVLRTEGLVYTRQGKGAFVRQRPPLVYVDFSHGVAELGAPEERPRLHDVHYRVLEVGAKPATPALADRFALAEGETLLARRFLMLVGNEPFQIQTSYFNFEDLAATPLARREPVSTYDVLRDELGYELRHLIQDIRSRVPNVEEAKLLGLGPGDAVLYELRTAYGRKPKSRKRRLEPITVLEAVMSGERYVARHRIPMNVYPRQRSQRSS